jgi:hypothetical protein
VRERVRVRDRREEGKGRERCREWGRGKGREGDNQKNGEKAKDNELKCLSAQRIVSRESLKDSDVQSLYKIESSRLQSISALPPAWIAEVCESRHARRLHAAMPARSLVSAALEEAKEGRSMVRGGALGKEGMKGRGCRMKELSRKKPRERT